MSQEWPSVFGFQKVFKSRMHCSSITHVYSLGHSDDQILRLVDLSKPLGKSIMNRRQMLTNAVSGIGALAVVGVNASTAPGCDNDKGKGGKEDSKDPTIKSTGQVCPIYPCMFFGSYTMYYGMISNGTTCLMPKALNGPNSLPLGCENGGCSTAFDVQRGHCHDSAIKHGCGRRTPTGHLETPYGIDKLETDEIKIDFKNPNNPAEVLRNKKLRLYRLTVIPSQFDPTFLEEKVAALLRDKTDPTAICFGHEITGNITNQETFGTVDIANTAQADGSHVLFVKMTGEDEPFEVVIVKRKFS